MNTFKNLFVLPLLLLITFSVKAQDLEIVVHDTLLHGNLGDDIAFHFDVINISAQEQTVFEVRTINDLPHPDWTSSLCFGENCFPPSFDSVATSPPFPEPPLQPGDTLLTSLHVFPLTMDGTANVQLQVGTFRNPDDRFTLDFTAYTGATAVEEEEQLPIEYFISQNYPNPFNPSTKINFGVKKEGFVTLKVYNILGLEVASLVNENKPAGRYQVDFKAEGLSSGVYLYTIRVNNFSETRKMILEK